MRRAGLYGGWIALCAVLFAGLSDAEDPSRPKGRILSNDAGEIAQSILRRNACCSAHTVVHVAYARAGEGAAEARWVVLLDREPRSGLREAKVVELRAEDGSLIVVRNPQ